MAKLKPLYLFADSRLLFWETRGQRFLSRLLDDVAGPPTAAYIGASNGDRVEFYDMFCAATEAVGVRRNVMVRSEPTREEMRSLEEADIILLAGGDPLLGWQALERSGVKEVVARRYNEGAVLCGISAGAVQLGKGLSCEKGDVSSRFVRMFHFVPRVIDVHDEEGWQGLRRSLGSAGRETKGIGIPAGGGLAFDSENDSIEPIRLPLLELELFGETFRERALVPSSPSFC